MSNEIVNLEKINPLEVFTIDGVDPIIQKIKDEVAKFVPDMTSEKGRKEIASMARKVASSKTYMDDLGKKLVEGWKRQAAGVDAARKKVRDELDILKDTVRRPLTQWEEKEEARKNLLNSRLLEIINVIPASNQDEVKKQIACLESLKIDDSLGEYLMSFQKASSEAFKKLAVALTEIEKREAEQKELAKLRIEAAEREQKEKERKIAEYAAEKAKIEAESKAREEKDKIQRAAQQERDRIESEKQTALRAQKEAEEKVKRLEQEAEKKKQFEAQEEEKRAANASNLDHQREINQKALTAFVGYCKIDKELARDIVTVIALGKIPNVKIIY